MSSITSVPIVHHGILPKDSKVESVYYASDSKQGSWWQQTNWFRQSSQEGGDNNTEQDSATNTDSSTTTTTYSHKPIVSPGGARVFNRFQNQEPNEQTEQKVKKISLTKHLGELSKDFGLDIDIIGRFKQLVLLPLLKPNIFEHIGVRPIRGVVLVGANGSGKTSIAEKIATYANVYTQQIKSSMLLAQIEADSSTATKDADKKGTLTKLFDTMKQNAPSLLFIDDFELIAGVATTGENILLGKIRSTLCSEMDKLAAENKHVIVLGATTEVSLLSPILLRSGRFSQQIILSKPDLEGRFRMLTSMTKTMNLHSSVDIMRLAENTNGFVASDMAAMCSEAGLKCIQEFLDSDVNKDPAKENLCIHQKHFDQALLHLHPSSMRAHKVEICNVKWEDIGGYTNVKDNLREMIHNPMNHKSLYTHFKLKPCSGVLLYGPPGTGKTMMAKAVATECKANFLSVKGPELMTSYLGESERNIRNLFNTAKANSPSVIFFDEIDSLISKRGLRSDVTPDRVTSQLLMELDSLSYDNSNDKDQPLVFVIAATNRPWALDSALMINGRLEKQVYAGLPDISARVSILQASLRNTPLLSDVTDEFINDIAEKTIRFSGADLASICNLARQEVISRHIDNPGDKYTGVSKDDFINALDKCSPSVSRNVESQFVFYKLYGATSLKTEKISDSGSSGDVDVDEKKDEPVAMVAQGREGGR